MTSGYTQETDLAWYVFYWRKCATAARARAKSILETKTIKSPLVELLVSPVSLSNLEEYSSQLADLQNELLKSGGGIAYQQLHILANEFILAAHCRRRAYGLAKEKGVAYKLVEELETDTLVGVELMSPPVAQEQGQRKRIQSVGRVRRILVVEDMDAWWETTARVIERALGLPPDRASSLEEARAKLEEMKNFKNVLVLLDLGIPIREGEPFDHDHGFALMEGLCGLNDDRRIDRRVIVVTTPQRQISDHVRAYKAGVEDLIFKIAGRWEEELDVCLRRICHWEGTISRIVLPADGHLGASADELSIQISPLHKNLLKVLGGYKKEGDYEEAPGNARKDFLARDVVARLSGYGDVTSDVSKEIWRLRTKLQKELKKHGKFIGHRDVIKEYETLNGTRYSLQCSVDVRSDVDSTEQSAQESFRVLVVEDTESWQQFIEGTLKRMGYECSLVSTLSEAEEAWNENGFHAVCLDLSFPANSGEEPLRESGTNFLSQMAPDKRAAVVVLSDYAPIDDLRLDCQRLGVRLDAVVDKGDPGWDGHLLRALFRVEQDLSRGYRQAELPPLPHHLSLQGMDSLWINDRPLSMGRTQFRLLRHLARHPNTELDGEKLTEWIWPQPEGSADGYQRPKNPANALSQLAKHVRTKIEEAGFDGKAILPILNSNRGKAHYMLCGRIQPNVVVLLVDDNQDQLDFYAGEIERLTTGHELHVLRATSYQEALKVLKQYCPDILITDVNLGGPNTGYNLAQEAVNEMIEWVLVFSSEATRYDTPINALGYNGLVEGILGDDVIRTILEEPEDEAREHLIDLGFFEGEA